MFCESGTICFAVYNRILRLNFISQPSLILSVASGNILEQRHYFIEERINRKK